MARLIGFFLFLGALSLACASVTQPIADAKNLAATAEAFASAMPSQIPDVTGFMNPQGEPVAEWNGIPIMTQASAGQEFNASTYSYKARITAADAVLFYKEKLTALGWTQPFDVPSGSNMAVLIFQKESSFLTITVAPAEDEFVVVLNLR